MTNLSYSIFILIIILIVFVNNFMLCKADQLFFSYLNPYRMRFSEFDIPLMNDMFSKHKIIKHSFQPLTTYLVFD